MGKERSKQVEIPRAPASHSCMPDKEFISREYERDARARLGCTDLPVFWFDNLFSPCYRQQFPQRCVATRVRASVAVHQNFESSPPAIVASRCNFPGLADLPVACALAACRHAESGHGFPGKSRREHASILRGEFTSLGRQLAEVCQFPRYSRENVNRVVVYDGFENYERAFVRGRRVVPDRTLRRLGAFRFLPLCMATGCTSR